MKSDNSACTRKLTTQFVDESGSNASLPAPPRSTNAVNYNMTLCMWKKHQRHQTTVPSTDAAKLNLSLVLQLTIVFNVGGHVIVDDMLDGGEVQALGGHVCCNKDVLSPFTELSDRPLTLLLVYGVRERLSFLKI